MTTTALLALWCVACATVEQAPTDPRLVEAQQAFDEGKSLSEGGKKAEAVLRLERALELREAALTGTHPLVAHCLSLLGDIHMDLGDYARAEPLLVRALRIRETALGENHRDVGESANLLAILYYFQGHYARAEPLMIRALKIREAALDEHHPDVARALNNLAHIYIQQGHYARAEPLLSRALKLQEEAAGENHPEVANLRNNLASLYMQQGLYTRAEPLLVRALKIRETALGENHPEVGPSVNNLGNLYANQGLYARAEPLLLRALKIWETAVGENHPGTAGPLHNLANLYLSQGLDTRAEPLLLRTLKIREDSLGPDHPEVAPSLHNLSYLYMNQGQYTRAESLLSRALRIREAAFGADHPEVASSLHSLAALYYLQGLYARAEPLMTRALELRETALGEAHPHVASSLDNLARIRLAQQNLGTALPLLERAFSASEQHLRQEVFGFSEKNLDSFLGLLRTQEERYYALARAHPGNARVLRLALSAALLRKGRSLQEVANTSLVISRNLEPADRETFERMRGLRSQLASLSLAGPGKSSPADYRQRLQALAAEGDALEADLSRRSAPLRALAALPSVTDMVDRVAQALPRDGALVELIAYEDKPLVPEPGTPESKVPSELRYLALVLFPDARIQALDLGPAAPIDQAASHLRDALARRDATFQALAQAFYQRAFKPLQFLLDSYDFSYVTSGKDLLPRPEEIAPSRSVVVFADPDFRARPSAPAVAQTDTPGLAERSAPVENFFASLRADGVSQSWLPLPGSRQEAEALQRLIPRAQLFLGRDATKERLLNLPTPGVLHIATHGFFLGEPPAPQATRGVGHFGALGEGDSAPLPADPLLRSGLALAGADAPERGASPSSSPSRDSVLITALELAGLDLWGTELVVLSACDTGRGDITRGQGVYGLRRALIVAGAETVVMSLWKVNDNTTRLLMETYYRNLLAGQGRASALRSLRASKPHPHYWAPFIALGRDAPLRALQPVLPPAGP